MLEIKVIPEGKGKQVTVQAEGGRLDILAELVQVTKDIMEKYNPSERFAFLMTLKMALETIE